LKEPWGAVSHDCLEPPVVPGAPTRSLLRRVPVHTIFESHPEDGVCAIAISQDSKYLVTISAGTEQVKRISISQLGANGILTFEFQDYVLFNPQNPHEFVSNSKKQVLFYVWVSRDVGSSWLLSPQTFKCLVGQYSQSVFHFNNTQALTATSTGKLVVWDMDDPRTLPEELPAKPHGIIPAKVVSMQKEGLTVLQTLESCVVTGDVTGKVKFYDGQLRILAIYSYDKVGPIQSISFSTTLPSPSSPGDLSDSSNFVSLTLNRNFILSTSDATMFHVATDSTNFERLLEEPKKAVNAIACHPQEPFVAVGSHCGLLKVWDYKETKYLVSRIFPETGIQCLCYDPEGYFLAAGFTDGSVHILDAISLQSICEEFQFSQGPVTHISFSHDSKYLATADEKYTVTVYRKVLQNGSKCWEHLAGLESHYKPIRTILFGVHSDSNEPRLLSLGEDRQLVEYDLKSSIKDHLVVTHRDRLEQDAVPLCLVWYPKLSTESFFLTANNYYKMKLYNTTTKMCR
uniref:Cilia- and flagella-associated protein 251 n=1 Tax=Malurus cyaneus samueli TaxID=2593467 RepID=A0A8C5UIH1_9PASS